MTVHINFDTGSLTREEGSGLSAFLGAVQPSLLTAVEQREYETTRYGFGHQMPVGATALPESNVVPAPAAPIPLPPEEPKAEPAKRGRKPKAEDTKPNISATPENRIDPETPEAQQQDAEDEAAETPPVEERELTADDLRAAIGKYTAKFTAAAAEDGIKIFEDAIGKPANDPHWRIPLVVAAGQETLAKAIKAWNDATARDKRYGA